MATMIIAGEKLQMPVWLKARLLEIHETDTTGVLSVESGSECGKRYPVSHDGIHATSCPCRATIDKCAHMLAAERYLALASDVQAHLDDELNAQDEESDGELAALAEAIIHEEKQRKEAQIAKSNPYHYKRQCAFRGIERRFERTPSGSMVLMR